MGKLFSFNMITLDGYFEGPNGEIDWHNVDDEFNEFAIEQTGSVDMLLFGRKTYELMAGYWPTPQAKNDDPVVAGLMNDLPKVVFSTTLPEASWSNTRLIRENLAEEVLKLKQQSSRDLAVFGSADLLASLIRLNLVDEHRVMVNPVTLGQGHPLFKDRLSFNLVKTKEFRSGNILLYYR